MIHSPVTIRPARPEDASAVVALLAPYVEEGLILPRSEAEIGTPANPFLVAEQASRIVGCVSLRPYSPELVEIRSLAVHAELAGKGTGSLLVEQAVRIARERGYRRVFALTRRPNLFVRLGFRTVPMETFPEKVWTDCQACPRREHCDEIAVLFTG